MAPTTLLHSSPSLTCIAIYHCDTFRSVLGIPFLRGGPTIRVERLVFHKKMKHHFHASATCTLACIVVQANEVEVFHATMSQYYYAAHGDTVAIRQLLNWWRERQSVATGTGFCRSTCDECDSCDFLSLLRLLLLPATIPCYAMSPRPRGAAVCGASLVPLP